MRWYVYGELSSKLIPNQVLEQTNARKTLSTHRMRSELSQAMRGKNPQQLQSLEWRHFEAFLHAPGAPQSFWQLPAVASIHGGINRTERFEQLSGKAHVGPYEWYY